MGPSYKRATWLQAPLAVVSCLAGVAAWAAGADLTRLHAVRTALSLAALLAYLWTWVASAGPAV